MKNIFQVLLLNLFILSSFGRGPIFVPEGYFVGHEELKSNYQIEKNYDARDFLSFILAENPRLTATQAASLTKNILRVAQCFEIDAKLFLALIRVESNFRIDAVSPTGAVGLTQFTSIGAQEVSDQLGQRGRRYGNVRNTNYLNNIIKGCSDKWQQLWLRKQEWKDQKLLFLEDMDLALIYGAVLLKVYLAMNYDQDLIENYYYAFVDYNGEPGERKYWYARTILQFYNEI